MESKYIFNVIFWHNRAEKQEKTKHRAGMINIYN